MDFNERQKKMRELQRGAGFTEEVPAKEIVLSAPEYQNAKRPKREEETPEERAIRLAKWREEFKRQQELANLQNQIKYGFPGINGLMPQRSLAAPAVELVDPNELEPKKKMPLIPNYGIGTPKNEDE